MLDVILDFFEEILSNKRLLKVAAILISIIIAYAVPLLALPIGIALGYTLKPQIDKLLKKLTENSKDKRIKELEAKIAELTKKLNQTD
ncbi:MAG: hypothetical protein NWE94_01815 [Candidatus Bathyarchaeota archaeon]|nr:hypothetical protein [Candidatus Bathyarchaeota archaeon]